MRARDESGHAIITLRPLTENNLALIRPWFEDPVTRTFLGGPDWPAAMLKHSRRAIGAMFRGAMQTGAHHYLAHADDVPVGYIDCGTFDRCTVYGGESADGPIILETIGVPSGSIAFVIDPALRGRGLGRRMIAALVDRPELLPIELFEAGVDPDNVGSRHCLQAAGFEAHSVHPDFEGMLYYQAWRQRPAGTRSVSAG